MSNFGYMILFGFGISYNSNRRHGSLRKEFKVRTPFDAVESWLQTKPELFKILPDMLQDIGTKHRFVLMDESLMQEDDDCLVAEFIKDTGAKLIAFSNLETDRNVCCDTISSNITKQELDIVLRK